MIFYLIALIPILLFFIFIKIVIAIGLLNVIIGMILFYYIFSFWIRSKIKQGTFKVYKYGNTDVRPKDSFENAKLQHGEVIDIKAEVVDESKKV